MTFPFVSTQFMPLNIPYEIDIEKTAACSPTRQRKSIGGHGSGEMGGLVWGDMGVS